MTAPRFVCMHGARGWTLLEFAIVLVVSSLLVYVAVRTFHPKDALALEQAERLRNDLQHAQMLAITWGQPLRIATTANSYQVNCVTPSATPPCNATPVVDPATKSPFSVTLESGLSLSGAGFDISALGRPSSAASFTISAGGAARTVTVAAITGFVVAQ